MNLLTAASDLTSYAVDHPFDPTKFKPPGNEYWRDIEHHGHEIRICFTRMEAANTPNIRAWLLSVYSIDPPAPALVSPEIGAEIAFEFFKEPIPQNEALDIIKMSRKYLKIEKVKTATTKTTPEEL